MKIFPPKKIKIVNIQGKGFGVVSTKIIKKNEIIEICPVIYLSDNERKFIENKSDTLYHYYLYIKKINKFCIMFGYGSIYNHDLNANASFECDNDISTRILKIRAIKNININEEIIIDYKFNNNKEEFFDLK